MNINGRFILYGSIILFCIIVFINKWNCCFRQESKIIITEVFGVLYTIYSFVGAILFFINLNYKEATTGYEYNLDTHYLKKGSDNEGNYYNENFPYFRAFSIIAWVFYGWYHLDKYFKNIKIKI